MRCTDSSPICFVTSRATEWSSKVCSCCFAWVLHLFKLPQQYVVPKFWKKKFFNCCKFQNLNIFTNRAGLFLLFSFPSGGFLFLLQTNLTTEIHKIAGRLQWLYLVRTLHPTSTRSNYSLHGRNLRVTGQDIKAYSGSPFNLTPL